MAGVGRPGWLAGLALPVLLGGCGHRDVIDTPVSWWHGLEGGAIAEQRPPPPGVDDPYPHIGTTPAAAPQVASADLRHAVTANLVEQRDLSSRLNAHDPLPPPAPAPAPAPATTPAGRTAANGSRSAAGLPATAPPPAAAQSSAVLDAADAPSAPTPAPAAPARPAAAADPAGGNPPDLAMPALVAQSRGPDAVLPPIPDAPPPAPILPGLSMPPPPSYLPPPHPDYARVAPVGSPLAFAPGSDVLAPGQAGTLMAIASHRGGAPVFVHGYGDAASDLPGDQSQALTLAAYRARSVAEALEHAGVPAAAIRIRTDAFGRGATAGLID